jgi:hypothetical protein
MRREILECLATGLITLEQAILADNGWSVVGRGGRRVGAGRPKGSDKLLRLVEEWAGLRDKPVRNVMEELRYGELDVLLQNPPRCLLRDNTLFRGRYAHPIV